jgi:putative ABC transport system permease protein
MYLPHAQWVRAKKGGSPQFGMTVVVRAPGDPAALLARVRQEVRAMDAALPISEARSLEDVASSALAQPRFLAASLGVFAALALALAATGLYGVTAFMAARRRHEIGIRVALGARPGLVAGLIVRDSLGWAAGGVAVGWAVSLWVTRLLAGQLHGVSPLDPLTYAVAPAILLAVAALASSMPAWRAARASPVAALRGE